MATFGTFTAGAVLTAAELNTAGGAWTTFTPSWTNFTLGNGTVNYARYEQVGRTVKLYVKVTLGSTSSVGTVPTLTLPVTAAYATLAPVSDATYTDASGGPAYYDGQMWIPTTTTGSLYCANVASTYPTVTGVTATVPFTWTTSDVFEFCLQYEAAADGT